jgi:hypothetical protein
MLMGPNVFEHGSMAVGGLLSISLHIQLMLQRHEIFPLFKCVNGG